MRATLPAIVVFAACAATLQAQNATTALSAIKLLPKAAAKRIARIEAREGNPTPERWYILVHDPDEETGLKEYVVAGGEVVAARSLSQFAEGLKQEEVVGYEGIRFDSDRAARLAQSYAVANNVIPASLNYQLRKDDGDGTAVWNVTCIDGAGKPVGGLVVAAGKGTVLSRTGFAVEPAPDKKPRVEPSVEDDSDTGPSKTSRKRYVVRSRPPQPTRQAPPPQEKPNLFQRLFGPR